MTHKTKDEEGQDPAERRTQSHSSRFPEDQCIRDAGFSIAERKKGQEAQWQRQGHPYTHRQALAIAKDERAKRIADLVKKKSG